MALADCPYFHASRDELPIGRVLTAHTVDKKRDSAFERIVDRARPAHLPERRRVFYLGDDPAALFALGAQSLKHIYRVRPSGTLLRTDAMWLIKAAKLWHTEGEGEPSRRVALYVKKAWAGAKSPWFLAWEYLAPRIVVCQRLSEPERYRAVSESDRRSPGFREERIFKRMMLNAVDTSLPMSTRIWDAENIAADMGLAPSYDVQRVRQYVPAKKRQTRG